MLHRLWNRVTRLVRAHEHSSIQFVIVTHLVLVVLELVNRAAYPDAVIQWKLLEAWASSNLWLALSSFVIGWLLVWRTAPKVIWGLWTSVAVLLGWGMVNMTVGLLSERPVSLLGPALILFVATPLSWTTADAIQDRVESDRD